MGAEEVHHVFSDLLWSQRSNAAQPPASQDLPSCQPTSQLQSPLLMSEHLVIDQAVWCELTQTSRPGWRPARLTRTQVAALNERFTTEESVSRPCRGRPQLSGAMNVVNAWGDEVTLRGMCQDLYVPVPFGDPELVWALSDEARTLLATLPLGRSIKNVPYDPDQIRPVD